MKNRYHGICIYNTYIERHSSSPRKIYKSWKASTMKMQIAFLPLNHSYAYSTLSRRSLQF